MRPVETILSKLRGVTPLSGGGYSALCPAHDDAVNSLSVSVGHDGRVLLRCHAGCQTSAVVAAMGLAFADLFPRNGGGGDGAQRRVTATYQYRDEHGRLLYEVVRYIPKTFAQRRPDGHGGWTWNLDGVRRVPYRLPLLLAADPAQPVFVTEGEKDADALVKLGLVATTNAGGAGKWRDEYADVLAGRHVVILPDNDDAGERHAAQVAQSLHGKAASVKVIRLPGLPPKGDVSDWLMAGGTAERLLELAAGGAEWQPAAAQADGGERGRRTSLRRYRPSEIVALELPSKSPSLSLCGAEGYIEEGGTHLLGAKPKTGKTELLFRAACGWTDKGVLYISEEGERVWKKRLSAFSNLPDHIEIICALGEPPEAILQEVETTEADVVIVDTVRNLLGIPNELDNAMIAMKLTPFVAAAQRRGLTFIAVQHLRKQTDGDLTDLFSGGNAYSGVFDILLALQRKQGDEKRLELRRRGRGDPDAVDLFEWRDGDLLWLGDAAGMERRQLRERALGAINSTEEWLKTKEVRDLMGDPKPSVNTLLEVLAGLFADGLVERDPSKPKERATYRWRKLSANLKEGFAQTDAALQDSREKLSVNLKEGFAQTDGTLQDSRDKLSAQNLSIGSQTDVVGAGEAKRVEWESVEV
jgi:hypothetical protein